MNIWIARKDLMKHHYLKRKIFYSKPNMEDITDTDYKRAKKYGKTLK